MFAVSSERASSVQAGPRSAPRPPHWAPGGTRPSLCWLPGPEKFPARDASLGRKRPVGRPCGQASSGGASEPPALFPVTMVARGRETEPWRRGLRAAAPLPPPVRTFSRDASMAEAARWRPGSPGSYFRLPLPAAVSTLAELTSPAPAAGGVETRRSCRVAPRGGESAGLGEAGRGAEGGRGPLGFRTCRDAGQPNAPR